MFSDPFAFVNAPSDPSPFRSGLPDDPAAEMAAARPNPYSADYLGHGRYSSRPIHELLDLCDPADAGIVGETLPADALEEIARWNDQFRPDPTEAELVEIAHAAALAVPAMTVEEASAVLERELPADLDFSVGRTVGRSRGEVVEHFSITVWRDHFVTIAHEMVVPDLRRAVGSVLAKVAAADSLACPPKPAA